MRQVPHNAALEELRDRGFQTEWIEEYNSQHTYDIASDRFDSTTGVQSVLDFLEVEGQVHDGLFEDPYNGPDWDFTAFFNHPKLVGRMMYFAISFAGLSYTYEDLMSDIEDLAEQYDAPFDSDELLENSPTLNG